MRKTKRKPLDSAITAAWEKVFAETVVDDIEAFLAEGWMLASEFAKHVGTNRNTAAIRLKRLAEVGRVESKKIRAFINGKSRDTTIYRPHI